MPRLYRLDIRGFKSVRALEGFEPRALNVLIGPNGAGKTHFIELFQMLARMTTSHLRQVCNRAIWRLVTRVLALPLLRVSPVIDRLSGAGRQ